MDKMGIEKIVTFNKVNEVVLRNFRKRGSGSVGYSVV